MQAVQDQPAKKKRLSGKIAKAFIEGKLLLKDSEEFIELFRVYLQTDVAFAVTNSPTRPIPVLFASESIAHFVAIQPELEQKNTDEEIFEALIEANVPYEIARALYFYYSHFFPNLLR